MGEDGAQVERRPLGFEGAGLGLGDVEEFVDESEQGAAGAGDQRELAFAFLGRRVGVGAEQFGEADHGVDGGAQFVADVRPEPALGFAGLAQLA